MATPRYLLVDPENPLFYHLSSRCVRQSWLCGFDRKSRKDYTHRKKWLVERLKQLGAAFAVDVYAYAVMSNHFHLVVYYDPKAPERWSADDVIDRWLRVCPPRRVDGAVDEARRQAERRRLLTDPEQVRTLRGKLGSISTFMKLLKQPIARRANLEDDCTGHFFEQRFYSGALLSEEAVVAAMAYVDLNPIRAKIAKTIANAKHTSIFERLRNAPVDVESYVGPVAAGVGARPPFELRLKSYVERLEVLTPASSHSWPTAKLKRWQDQVFNLQRRQRVYGQEALIRDWIAQRGWRALEIPLPE